MATTFHITNWRNKFLNNLTGNGGSAATIYYLQLFNGVQPYDPSVTPVGAQVYSSIAGGIPLASAFTASGGGISQLNAQKAQNANSTVNGITFGRLYDSSQTPLIDAAVGVGSGPIQISSLNAVVGNAVTLTALSLKIPYTNGGTLLFSQALQDRLMDMWTGNSATIPGLGYSSEIDIYSGAAPATADAPATGTLLASFIIPSSPNLWAAAANACAVLASNPTVTAIGNGTAGYFRWYKTVGGIVMTVQGSVGLQGSGSDFVLSVTSLTSGVTPVSLTEATLSM
jgi:hypothetical protein